MATRLHCLARPASFAVAAIALTAVSCSGLGGPKTDPMVEKARTVYRDVVAQDPQYARYGLDVAARSSASFTGDLILESIGSPNYQIAVEAARAAGRRGLETAREALRTMTETKEGVLQLEAALALARLGDEAAMTFLLERIADASGRPNATVAAFLATHGHADAVRPVLAEALKSDDRTQRDETYAVLGQVRETWATEMLLAGFEKEFGEDRKAALVALGQSGDPGVAKKLRRFINTRGLVFATIEALGDLDDPESKDTLSRLARGSNEKLVQVYAAAALWKLGDETTARSVLEPLAQDPDPIVRANLAEQIGRIRDAGVLPLLGFLTEDAEAQVRVPAMRSLRERADPGLQEILLGGIDDEEYQVAVLALDALGEVGLPDAVESLEPLLEAENGYVAISAANAILEIKARAAAGAGRDAA